MSIDLSNKKYPTRYNLLDYDVFFEDNPDNPRLFHVEKPEVFTYGKHAIYYGYGDTQEEMKLRVGSKILVEILDKDDQLIYHQLIDKLVGDGRGSGFAWVKEDPAYTYDKVKPGIGKLVMMGELDKNSAPSNWVGKYNCRIVIPINIRPKSSNRSPLHFKNKPTLTFGSQNVDDSTIGRVGLPSLVRSFLNLETDNLETVSGKLSFIEASYKSDANENNEYIHLDTYPISDELELLTTTMSKAGDVTWIGDFNKTSNEIYWSGSGAYGKMWNPSGDLNFGASSNLTGSWKPAGYRYSGPGHAGEPSGPGSQDQVFIHSPIIRRCASDEWFTIRYNPSGSFRVAVFGTFSQSVDELMEGRCADLANFSTSSYESGSEYITSFAADHQWPDTANRKTLYYKNFNYFHPSQYSGSFINGTLITTQSNDYHNPTGSNTQIIQDDFFVPSGSAFNVYLFADCPISNNGKILDGATLATNRAMSFSNISIKPKSEYGTNPGTFYRRVELKGLARREENITLKLRYLNSDMSVAYELDNIDTEVSTSAAMDYNPEALWIERGKGVGVEGGGHNSDIKLNIGSRFTTVTPTTGSNEWAVWASDSNYSASIGVMGEASMNDDFDAFRIRYPSHTGSNGGTNKKGNIFGGYFVASRPSGSDARVVGLSAEAWDSGSSFGGLSAGDNDVWAARFEHGDVFINDNLYMSGSITAETFITSHSIQNINISSGSTIFGNTVDDEHRFTGSLWLGAVYPAINIVKGEAGLGIINFLNNGTDTTDDVDATIYLDGSENFQIATTQQGGSIYIDAMNDIFRTFANFTSSGDISCSKSDSQIIGGYLSASNGIFINKVGATANEKLFVIKEDGSERFAVDEDGDIFVQGQSSLDGAVYINTTIGGHSDDSNTLSYISWQNQHYAKHYANNELLLTLYGGTATTPYVTIGDGGDVNFKVRSNLDDYNIWSDGNLNRVGIGTNTPSKKLTVEGDISASGFVSASQLIATNITASGGISASKLNLGVDSGTGIYFGEENTHGLLYDDMSNIIFSYADSDVFQVNDSRIQFDVPLDITDSTNASGYDGDSGALRTEGGASIAKSLYVGEDIYLKNSQKIFFEGASGNDTDSQIYHTDADNLVIGNFLQDKKIVFMNTHGAADGFNVPIVIDASSQGVGIYQTSPSESLDVSGSINVYDQGTGGHITASGNISASGAISGAYFVGNGTWLTGWENGPVGTTGGFLSVGTGSSGEGRLLDVSGMTSVAIWKLIYPDLDENERHITLGSNNSPTIRITAVGGDREPRFDLCRSSYQFSGAENYTDYRLTTISGHFYFQSRRSGYAGGDITNVWNVNAENQTILIGSSGSNGSSDSLAPDTMATSSLVVAGDIWCSGSIPTAFGNVGGNITASGQISSSGTVTSSLHSLYVGTSVTASGDITLGGDVYSDLWRRESSNSSKVKIKLEADKIDFHTAHSSAPTFRFEDSSSFLEGSLTASGNISASSIIASANATSSFHSLYTETSVTASGDISASGDLHAEDLRINDDIFLKDGGQLNLNNTIDDNYIKYTSVGDKITLKTGTVSVVGASANIGSLDISGHITASGNISASSIIVDGNLTSSFHSIYAETSVTASTVSASQSTHSSSFHSIYVAGAITSSALKVRAATGAGFISTEKGASSQGGLLMYTDTSLDALVYLDGNEDLVLKTQNNGGNLEVDLATGKYTDIISPLYVNQPEYKIGALSVNYGDATSSLGNDGSDLGRGYGDIVKRGNITTIAGHIYKFQANGNIGFADMDNPGSDGSSLLGVALGTNSGDDGLLLKGFAVVSQSGTSTLGQRIYLGDSGVVTGSAPAGSGKIVRILGYCLDAGVNNTSCSIYFNPDNTWVELS
jgi:hypothetical protein